MFASNNPADPGVKKVHAVRKTTAKLTNSPEHCFIFNDDVKSVPVPDKLDRQWYIDFANKKIIRFRGGVMDDLHITYNHGNGEMLIHLDYFFPLFTGSFQ